MCGPAVFSKSVWQGSDFERENAISLAGKAFDEKIQLNFDPHCRTTIPEMNSTSRAA
jgi:hypothetical protein